jgi:hypothetical protein
MRRNFRRLFWVEIGLAAITGLLALITPIFPDWIEFVSVGIQISMMDRWSG